MEAVNGGRCWTGFVAGGRTRSSSSSSTSKTNSIILPTPTLSLRRRTLLLLRHAPPCSLIRSSSSPPEPSPPDDHDEAGVGNNAGLIQTANQSKMVHVKFVLQQACLFGQQFVIVGNHPNLSMWNPSKAISMEWSDGHVWSAELDLPVDESIHFKFILQGSSGEIYWQPGVDRILHTWETKNTIVVFEEWETADNQKIVEEEPSAILTEESISKEWENADNEKIVEEEPSAILTEESIPEEWENADKQKTVEEEPSANLTEESIPEEWENADKQKTVEEEPSANLTEESISDVNKIGIDERVVDETQEGTSDNTCRQDMVDQRIPSHCDNDLVLVPGLPHVSVPATTTSIDEHLIGKVDDTSVASDDESCSPLQLSGQQEPELPSGDLIKGHTIMQSENTHDVDSKGTSTKKEVACSEEDNPEESTPQPVPGVVRSDVQWGIKILHQFLSNLGFQSDS